MRRLFRSYPVPLWVVAVLLSLASVGFAAWASEVRDHQRDTAQYERNADRLVQLAVGSHAALAIVMQGRQYEAEKAGQLEAKVDEANGRLGPMQRKINDLQEDVERLRTNWTSELGVEP